MTLLFDLGFANDLYSQESRESELFTKFEVVDSDSEEILDNLEHCTPPPSQINFAINDVSVHAFSKFIYLNLS